MDFLDFIFIIDVLIVVVDSFWEFFLMYSISSGFMVMDLNL